MITRGREDWFGVCAEPVSLGGLVGFVKAGASLPHSKIGGGRYRR